MSKHQVVIEFDSENKYQPFSIVNQSEGDETMDEAVRWVLSSTINLVNNMYLETHLKNNIKGE